MSERSKTYESRNNGLLKDARNMHMKTSLAVGEAWLSLNLKGALAWVHKGIFRGTPLPNGAECLTKDESI